MTNCLDISNYTGNITAQNVADWKANGVDTVIVGLLYPSYPYPIGVAHQQLATLISGGMRVECYAESQSITYSWQFVQQFKPFIERIWVAAEEDHIDAVWLDQELAFADSLNLLQPAGIYTGHWWWWDKPFAEKYADRPLFLADYDGYLTPLHPWTDVTVWQHAGTSTFANVPNVDLNIYYRQVTAPALAVQETELTRDEVIALIDAAIEAQVRSPLEGGEFLWQQAVEAQLDALFSAEPVVEAARSAVHPVGININPDACRDGIFAVRDWLRTAHNCTFDVQGALRIDCAPDYDTIKSALLAAGVSLVTPTYAHAPGPVGPGSFGDPEMLAVKEVADPAIIAHELAHLWTGLGNEAHATDFPDTDGNPFNYLSPYSILGNWATAGAPLDKAKLLPAHLQLALERGYIRPI